MRAPHPNAEKVRGDVVLKKMVGKHTCPELTVNAARTSNPDSLSTELKKLPIELKVEV